MNAYTYISHESDEPCAGILQFFSEAARIHRWWLWPQVLKRTMLLVVSVAWARRNRSWMFFEGDSSDIFLVGATSGGFLGGFGCQRRWPFAKEQSWDRVRICHGMYKLQIPAFLCRWVLAFLCLPLSLSLVFWIQVCETCLWLAKEDSFDKEAPICTQAWHANWFVQI